MYTVAAAEAEEPVPVSIAPSGAETGAVEEGAADEGVPEASRNLTPVTIAAPAATGVPVADPTPSDLARASSGLCYFHWVYADTAGKCVAPCSWGN